MILKLATSAILLLCQLFDPRSATDLPKGDRCLVVRVDLNGHALPGPDALTFKTVKGEQSVHLDAGCFRIPAELGQEKLVDVFFVIARNRIYLSSIPGNLMIARWDIEINDKRFNKKFVLPKGVRARNACAITFRTGEPETSSVMAPCRSRI